MKNKKTIRILMLCILCIAYYSCSDPLEDNEDLNSFIDPVETLLSPEDNLLIDLSDKTQSSVLFKWEHSKTSNNIKPKYEVIFYKAEDSPSDPLHKVSTTSNGISVNYSKLDEIASNAGISVEDQGKIKWSVRSFNNELSVISKSNRTIILKRPKEQLPIELSNLLLTGKGSEYGENISEAIPFSKVSNNDIVVYSELIAGQPIQFINRSNGDDNIRYYSIEKNKIIESDDGYKVNKSGVFKITINTSTKSVTINEITDISLYYCIKHRAIGLEYIGMGMWETVSLINFSKEDWGDETRYKFMMTEGNTNKFLEKSDNPELPMKESTIVNHNQQLWDGIWGFSAELKNRWSKITVDMNKYSHIISPVQEDFSSINQSWSDIAERSTSSFLQGFWNNSRSHFNNSLSGQISQYDYWPEAHAIDVIIDAFLRSNNNKYKQTIDNFYEGVKRKNGNKFKNSFYDDMAWHGLAHLRAFEATNDKRYEDSAKDLWNWIIEGWDYDNGGGIKWNDEPESTPGVPSTGPSTIIAIRRWVKYGETEVKEGLNNLEWAKKMYEWMRSERHDPATGGVYDNFDKKEGAWTYNTGTFLGAAMELYDETNNYSYLEDAIRTADWTIDNLSIETQNNKILSDWAEQEDHDVNLFKGIFIRYFTRLIMNPDLPKDKRSKYLNFIEYNAKAMLSYASITNNNDIMYNYSWYFKPKNTFLRGQTSGCMLLEAMALLEKEGYL